MSLKDLEETIFNCPCTKSQECSERFDCHPIAGYGSVSPKFVLIGMNPALRNGVWKAYKTPSILQEKYFTECTDYRFQYGRFLRRLENELLCFNLNKTVYLTDIVKCPVKQGNPSKEMVNNCVSKYLSQTINLLHPSYIIGLGSAVSKSVMGFTRTGDQIYTSKIVIEKKSYWCISAPHPSKNTNLDKVVREIKEAITKPSDYLYSAPIPSTRSKTMGNQTTLSDELLALGYTEVENHTVSNGKKTVSYSLSSEFGEQIAIFWKDHWEKNYAHIYDFRTAGGPVCIVPTKQLFALPFIRNKRAFPTYKNNPYSYANETYYWWRQKVRKDHEVARLILSYSDRWDLLK